MTLYRPLGDGNILLEPLAQSHRAELRHACLADGDIWPIYSSSFDADHFDDAFDRMLVAGAGRQIYAIVIDGHVVGMTGWIDADDVRQTVEIGNSYLAPDVRGTGLNGRIKRLMIDHAFEQGYRRIIFKIDERNARSQAAVRKLGAVKEGVLRQERITWTGHIRDTGLFSILAGEWRTA